MRRLYDVILALLYAALAYKITYPLWLVLGASYLRSINFISHLYYHLPKMLLTPATTGSIGLLCTLALAPRRPIYKGIIALLFILSLIPSTREILPFLHHLRTISQSGLRIKWGAYESLYLGEFYLRSFFPVILFGLLICVVYRWKNSHD